MVHHNSRILVVTISLFARHNRCRHSRIQSVMAARNGTLPVCCAVSYNKRQNSPSLLRCERYFHRLLFTYRTSVMSPWPFRSETCVVHAQLFYNTNIQEDRSVTRYRRSTNAHHNCVLLEGICTWPVLSAAS